MSAASCLLTEDQFLCSICLDVFTDPVTLPCGHNFCNRCITQHWDSSDQCLCPNCQRVYNTRPELHVNTFISEMAAQFRHSVQQKPSSSCSSSEKQAAKPGEVPCDVCTGTKVKALKSCLVCLASYCETHLEPHLTMSGLKRHQLMEPVENMEDRVCKQHEKLLELFCRTDQTCVCMFCTYSDHKTHDVVPLKEGYEGKKVELKKTEDKIQQMIQKRQQKIEEIKHSVKVGEERADREIVEGVEIFTALKESVDRGLDEFIKTVKEKQRTTEEQAEGFIKELEQEITALMKRSTEVNQLSLSEDHLHLLQSCSSLNTAPPTKDWKRVRVCPPSYKGTVRRAVSQLQEKLNEQRKKFFVADLRKVQQFAVDVTLDPNEVHPWPPQADECRCVLSAPGFTSGRFYFQVQVNRWIRWTLGVTSETNVKGKITLSPSNGFWTVSYKRKDGFFASGDKPVALKSCPLKMGVFVDYEEGLVFFYDVDTAALIHSFTGCSFTRKLHPFFSPCQNDCNALSWLLGLGLHKVAIF